MSNLKKFLYLYFSFSVVLISSKLVYSAETTAVRMPPFFWYESDPESHKKFLMALLLYWEGKDSAGEFNLLAPLYYNSKTVEEQIRVLLPFHFRYRSPESELNLWGPYLHKKFLQGESRFLFPLYFHSLTAEGQSTLFALYFQQQNPKFESKVFFPLFWNLHYHDPAQKSYETFIPFYMKIVGGKEMSKTIVSPFFWLFKDASVSQGLVPPYYWRHSQFEKTEIGFPIYWRFLWKEENSFKDVQVAVPWFRVQSDYGTLKAFVPLYWSRTKIFEQDTSSSSFSHAGTPRVAPLQESLRSQDTGALLKQSRWDLLLPLMFFSQKPDGSKKIVTPLFSRFRDEDGREYGHSGLNFFSRDVWGGRTEGLFPFFYYRSEPDFFKFRFLGLYIEKDYKEEHLQTSIFPLFRYRRDTDRKQFLTLFFYRDKDPDRSRGFLLSYFWRTDYRLVLKDASSASTKKVDDSVAPLGEENRIIAFRKRFLIPLAWHFQSETQKTTIVPPLLAFHSHEGYDLSFIAPFYFQRRKENDKLTVIPPLIARESPERRWLGLFFIFWQNAKPNQSSFTFFPLYRKSKFPDGYSLLFPGFYFLREGDETQGFALPYFWDHRGQTQYEIFPPFYLRFQRPTWTVKSFFPFYTIQTAQIKERGIFPLWAKTDSVTQSTATPKHFLADSHRFLPFYFYRKVEDGSDLFLPIMLGRIEKGLNKSKEKIVRGRMLLLNYWESSPTSFLNRFDPIYSYHRSQESKGFSAPTAPFPLWQYERDGLESDENKVVRGAFFPYYWKVSKTARQDLLVPVFYQRREKSPDGKKEIAKTTWLLNYYSSQEAATFEKKTFFVPIYWNFESKNERRTVVPPFWTERGPNFKRDILFPLVWSVSRDQESLAIFFPLVLKFSNRTEKRSATFMPGYWQSKDPETSTLLVGNFFKRESYLKGEKTTVFFPIIWDSRSPQRRIFSAFPLFWKLRAGARSITYLFPLYFRHQRENLEWKIAFPIYWNYKTKESEVQVIPPYFSIFSQDSQTKTTGIAPFWTYATNLREQWKNFQILGGLFGFEKSATKTTLTFLYFFHL